MSSLKKSHNWRNICIEEKSWSKKCLVEEVSQLEQYLHWTNNSFQEMFWSKKCLDWRNVLIEQISSF